MTTASIIPYPPRPAIGNKLLARDKIEVCLWEAGLDEPEQCRVVIHDQVDLGSELVDLVLIYGPASPWARWGIARREGMIALWLCSDGSELGLFATMRAALAKVERLLQDPAAQRRRAAPSRARIMPFPRQSCAQ